MFKIRQATTDDIEAILHLNNELCKFEMKSGFDTYIKDWSLSDESRAYFLDLIKNAFVIVAEKDAEIVGYLAGSINEEGAYSYYEGKTADLQNMFVKQDCRKYGLGSKFISEFENWCEKNGAKRLMVTASIDNESARAFYEKNGFSNINITLRKELDKKANKATTSRKVIIYTDGACSGNPGAGGWGAVLFYKGTKKEISGYVDNTTNNQMELTAAIKALDKLKQPCEVELYSDSAYLINAFNEGWIVNWQLNGFKNANKKPVLNADLWQQLIDFNNTHKIKWIKVKGHADNEYNNRCDELATGEIAKHQN